MMRIVSPLVLFFGLATGITSLNEARYGEALGFLALAVVAGLLLWRSLRNRETTRAMGEHASVAFTLQPGPGVEGPGTFALVKTLRATAWHVALDRAPQRGDLAEHGTPYKGWVWLGEDGLPEKVKIKRGLSFSNLRVTSAAPAEP